MANIDELFPVRKKKNPIDDLFPEREQGIIGEDYTEYADSPVATSLGKAVSNIPESAMKFGSAIVNAPKAIWEGVKSEAQEYKDLTQKPFGEAVTGIAAKSMDTMLGGNIRDQLWNTYKERYGGTDKIVNTIENDPIGVLADISTVFGAGGAVAKLAGVGGKLPKVLSAAETATNPLSPVVGTLKTVGKIQAEIPSLLHRHRAAFKALAGSDDFIKAMRGKITPEEIVGDAFSYLDEIKKAKNTQFQNDVASLPNFTNGSVDPRPIANTLFGSNGIMKRAGIRVDQNTGKLDMTFARTQDDALRGIIETTNNYFTSGMRSPEAWDRLHQVLNTALRSSKGQSRAYMSELKKVVGDQIDSASPGYLDMNKTYSKRMQNINEITTELSLNPDKRNMGTVLNKFQNAIKGDRDFREAMVARLQQAGGRNLLDMIEGNAMNKVWSKQFGASVMTLAALGMFGKSNPGLLAALAIHGSPRIMGEWLNTLGKAIRISRKTRKVATPLSRFGQVEPESNEENN